MTRRAQERLLDIRNAIDFIEAHVGGSVSAPSIAGPLVLHAVLFNLIVIGEAAKKHRRRAARRGSRGPAAVDRLLA
jgi:uncharacterized protein with HEPN domain